MVVTIPGWAPPRPSLEREEEIVNSIQEDTDT